MSTKLTLLEQETIILFNRQEEIADIYTHDPFFKKKLNRLCVQFPNMFALRKDNGIGGLTYSFPKNLITVRMPRAKKNLSDSEREVFRDQFKKNLSK